MYVYAAHLVFKVHICSFGDKMLTPLHLAAQNSHNEIVLLLIERRAKIDPKTNVFLPQTKCVYKM